MERKKLQSVKINGVDAPTKITGKDNVKHVKKMLKENILNLGDIVDIVDHNDNEFQWEIIFHEAYENGKMAVCLTPYTYVYGEFRFFSQPATPFLDQAKRQSEAMLKGREIDLQKEKELNKLKANSRG